VFDFETTVRTIVRQEMAKASAPPPIEEFLTTQQAANIIGMSASWLHQARYLDSPSQPPFYRFDRAVRYRRSDLLDWMETNRRVA
jgi:hypothetical protein